MDASSHTRSGQAGGGVEIFMTRFPTGEGGWQVSRGGGEGPVWPGEVDELVFWARGVAHRIRTQVVITYRFRGPYRPAGAIRTPINHADPDESSRSSARQQ